MFVYAIYNKLIGAYNPPIFTNDNKEVIQTQYKRYCILNKQEALANHFDESQLFYLGEFDDVTGTIKAVTPEYICSFDGVLKDVHANN